MYKNIGEPQLVSPPILDAPNPVLGSPTPTPTPTPRDKYKPRVFPVIWVRAASIWSKWYAPAVRLTRVEAGSVQYNTVVVNRLDRYACVRQKASIQRVNNSRRIN